MVVAHLDLDCFFVQVEQQKDPSLKGKKVAVQQHQDIICVSYEARNVGLKKHTHPDEAKRLIPDLHLVHVAKEFGTKVTYHDYRRYSFRVFKEIYNRIPHCYVEKVGLDEAYIDLKATIQARKAKQEVSIVEHNSVVYCGSASGSGSEYSVCDIDEEDFEIAARIVCELRDAILENTGLTCSAGISNSKVIAKVAANLNKPNKQTIVHPNHVLSVLSTIELHKLIGLKTKLSKDGFQVLQQLDDVKYVTELQKYNKHELQQLVGDKGHSWLYNIVNTGIDDTPVAPKSPPKSISVSMTLTPRTNNTPGIHKVITYMVPDVVCRLEEDLVENGSVRTLCNSSCTLRVKIQNLGKEVYCTWPIQKVTKSGMCQQQQSEEEEHTDDTVYKNMSTEMHTMLAASAIHVPYMIQHTQKSFSTLLSQYPKWSVTWISLSINFNTKKSSCSNGTPPTNNHRLDTMFQQRNRTTHSTPTGAPFSSPTTTTSSLPRHDTDDFFGSLMHHDEEEEDGAVAPQPEEIIQYLHCPICGEIQPTNQQGQTHINQCLDGSEPLVNKTMEEPDKAKPKQPPSNRKIKSKAQSSLQPQKKHKAISSYFQKA